MASQVLMSKVSVDGKRPGDVFTRLGVSYSVVQVRLTDAARYRVGHPVYVTESRYGREVWF